MALKKLNEITERVILKSIARSDKTGNSYVLTYKLSNNWNIIVGHEIANMMRVHVILDSSCLILKVMNPAHSVEANMYKDIIKQRINTHLGNNIISKVMIVS